MVVDVFALAVFVLAVFVLAVFVLALDVFAFVVFVFVASAVDALVPVDLVVALVVEDFVFIAFAVIPVAAGVDLS